MKYRPLIRWLFSSSLKMFLWLSRLLGRFKGEDVGRMHGFCLVLTNCSGILNSRRLVWLASISWGGQKLEFPATYASLEQEYERKRGLQPRFDMIQHYADGFNTYPLQLRYTSDVWASWNPNRNWSWIVHVEVFETRKRLTVEGVGSYWRQGQDQLLSCIPLDRERTPTWCFRRQWWASLTAGVWLLDSEV